MIGHVLRRLGWSALVVWFVVSATFAMTMAIPADPGKTLLGPHASTEALERVRAEYCLDRGFVGRYGCWIERIAHGDLGESYRTRRPVSEILADRIMPTVQLALAAIFLQLVIGLPLGILAAVRRGRWPDHATNAVGLIGMSAPTFVIGTVLLYVLSYRFGWFPIGGHGSGGWDRVHHLVLPAMTLAAGGIAYYARIVRTELVDVLGEDFVRTARAKGLSERAIVLRHALRPALGPLITLIGLDLGALLGGAVVTEFIFSWPGIGREVLLAIVEVDMPLILGVVLISAVAIAVANLLVDLAYLWLDPRLRDG